MEPKNIIIWQKWYDPFGLDDEDQEDLEDNNDNTSESTYDDDDEYSSPNSEEEYLKKNREYHINKKNISRVIATPMGFIPMNEHTSSGKIFNFWIGHTNFNITSIIASIIEHNEGIETLDIFTRYRFRISIGKAFNDSIIMREISNKICDITYE